MADVQTVANALQRTLNPATQRQAEAELAQIETHAGFAPFLLQLVAADQMDQNVRFAGAVYFKNFVKRHWVVDEVNKIADADRATIKAAIVDVMIAAPPRLQLQISDAVTIMANADFPGNWPTLITDLVSKLTPDNYHVNNGVLQTAHSIFKKWRHQYSSNAVIEEIKLVIDTFYETYERLFLDADARLTAAIATKDKAAADLFAHTFLLLAKLYLSMNVQDLPYQFEENQEKFFPVFLKYLAIDAPLLESDSDEDASTLDKVRAAICDIAALYTDKYSEEWNYLAAFVEATWMLLTKTSTLPKHDVLVARGMALLTTIVRRPAYAKQFESEATLKSIVEQIVVPNMQLRESDEEKFEDEPVEYVRRDLEGSDADTRKRSAADLVKGLLEQHEVPVTNLCVQYITQFMAADAAKPNLKTKDAAVSLFMAVASKSHATTAAGVRSTALNVPEFFAQYMLADLQASRGIATVNALRFLSMFRRQLIEAHAGAVLPLLGAHLRDQSFAVATWAAVVVDQLVKDLPAAAVVPHLPALVAALAAILQAQTDPLKCQEHDYVAKALYRCLRTGAADAGTVLPVCVHALQLTMANPGNPKFTHYLFESIAALIKSTCDRDAAAVAQFEQYLFPVFQAMLAQDIAEFMPYVFQVMAQLLAYHPASATVVPPAYDALLPPLLQPTLWENAGNVPALVALIKTYLVKAAPVLVARNQLAAVLGIFQKLVSSKAHATQGFELLQNIVACVPAAAFAPYRKAVLTVILTKLSGPSPAPKFVQAFIQFWAFYLAVAQPNAQAAIAAFGEVQPGLATSLISHFVAPGIGKLTGRAPKRAVLLGFGRLLAESPAAAELTAPLIVALVHLAADPTAEIAAADVDTDALEEMSYSAGFAKLHAAGDRKLDAMPAVKSAVAYFAQALERAAAGSPAVAQAVTQAGDVAVARMRALAAGAQ
ncbi:hypothetical protein AMAG_16397 [Allomyces macrogynus ATCC 38327]|uniref:Importin N-terminal domain-containing protein n=1 Tax=Allomyces macrogynus (strain ATCC 38327) TaxID=578462 RepID=A0A0L0TDI7_ALLM3|nr:hypothetical protein AMAG_16397 [Allomyces macrogynus ATCC 38327]|eukprot:KNE72634.1 hypothetical protein AMAG_16397 [Allomyces macrogynus ATCC 38327]